MCKFKRYRGIPVQVMSTEYIANALAHAIRSHHNTDAIPGLYEELGERLKGQPVREGYPEERSDWDMGGEIPF